MRNDDATRPDLPPADPASGPLVGTAPVLENVTARPVATPDDDQAARARSVNEPTRPAAFVDASALVALVDRDDASHVAAAAAYRDLVAANYALFTTNVALAETFDLLSAGLGIAVARQWLRDCQLPVYTVDAEDAAAARTMILAAADDRALSLTDALSLAVMSRLGVSDAFAVDQHFLAETT